MDVRVVDEPARVGLQHRDGAGRAFKRTVVLAERAHRLPTATHQQIVDFALVRTGQPPEFCGQGER